MIFGSVSPEWFRSRWKFSENLAQYVDDLVASGMDRAVVDAAAGFDLPIPYEVV